MARFNIINKSEKVVEYVLIATDKSPKKLRCDIIPELRKNSFRIIEDITRANFCELTDEESRKKRLDYQKDSLSTIRVLESESEICLKRNYLTEKQFEYLTKLTQELFDMIKNG